MKVYIVITEDTTWGEKCVDEVYDNIVSALSRVEYLMDNEPRDRHYFIEKEVQ